MKLLIINQPLNNRGDESAHKGLLRAILSQKHSLEIECLFIGVPSETLKHYVVNDDRVKYINIQNTIKGWSFWGKFCLKYGLQNLWVLHPTIKKVLKIYKEADWVVCAPGGISMGGFQNWPHLFSLYFAKKLGKNIAYYGRSFGPFPINTYSQRRYKKLSIDILRYFKYLSIRDKVTEKLARDLNLEFVSTVDSAFLDYPIAEISSEVQEKIKSEKYIVYVPNLLIWHYNYRGRVSKEAVMSFFTNMGKLLLESFPNHNIIMLPQTFNYNNYMDDYIFFKELSNNIADKRIIVVSDQYSSDIQQCIIRGASCMVGARYHSVVFALNNNVPFVALSYEHKIAGLLEALGKEECMVDIVHSMDDVKSAKKSLEEFKYKLSVIGKDAKSQTEAKKIARHSLNVFLAQL